MEGADRWLTGRTWSSVEVGSEGEGGVQEAVYIPS